MNNPSLARIITGVTIITVGIVAGLGTLNIINVSNFAETWWPLLVIIAGVAIYIANAGNKLWAGLVTLAGGVLLYNTLTDSHVNAFALFWPVIIVLFGVSLLRGRSKRATVMTTGADNHFVLMSGVEAKNASTDYKGGRVTAIMGGVELDLREAHIKDAAVLDVLTIMGGVELRVPRGWVVKSDAMALLGGVENKANEATSGPAPTLTIVGTVFMGGVEVKY